MSCQCKVLERQYGEEGCKCEQYRKQFPNCECENSSVSDHSPALVQDDELLIRTIYSPVQINQVTGNADPAYFRKDARTRGLSVNRKEHINSSELRSKIETKIARDQADGKERDENYLVVSATCGDIRSHIEEGGARLFCVYDTALEDDKSHADVCEAFEPLPGSANRKKERMKISSRLFEAFLGKATDLATVYGEEL